MEDIYNEEEERAYELYVEEMEHRYEEELESATVDGRSLDKWLESLINQQKKERIALGGE